MTIEYMDRDLSWMDFNERVLFLAMRNSIPLCERLKFLGITGSNLDEFIMVRIGNILKDVKAYNISSDIKLLRQRLIHFLQLQGLAYDRLLIDLKKNNVIIVKFNELTKKELHSITIEFKKNIASALTKTIHNTNNEFPLLKSRTTYLVTQTSEFGGGSTISFSSLETCLKKIYSLGEVNGVQRYVLLEDIVSELISSDKDLCTAGIVRVLRSAEVDSSNVQVNNPVNKVKSIVEKRKYSTPILLMLSENTPKSIEKLLRSELDLKKTMIYRTNKPLDYSIFASKPIRIKELEYVKFYPQYPDELLDEKSSILSRLQEYGDFVLHHPFDSFDVVVDFLREASIDKDVVSIHQTLYRVSSKESPVVDALCEASINGKNVTVLIELKARFDEEQNISLIDKMKQCGCNIIFGSEELKTHCKFTVILKKYKNKFKTYCHIGTGNYNEKTSRLYTDISYFTKSKKISQDLLSLFDILIGHSTIAVFNKIIVSPFNYRETLYNLIEQEIDNVYNGLKGKIIIKVNSLSDNGIIEKLYEASENGVKVIIICRGICSIRKINKNIIIKSVVGRFLEHSRIYYFHNQGKYKIFIASADLLTRNIDRRFELFMEIQESNLCKQLKHILNVYIDDTYNTFILDNDSRWSMNTHKQKFDGHAYFISKPHDQ